MLNFYSQTLTYQVGETLALTIYYSYRARTDAKNTDFRRSRQLKARHHHHHYSACHGIANQLSLIDSLLELRVLPGIGGNSLHHNEEQGT